MLRWAPGPLGLGLLAGFVAGCISTGDRGKTDVVQLTNGDRLTGEIKDLDRGKLRLSTTALETVYVEWDRIERVASTYAFEVEDKDGVLTFGRFEQGGAPGTITIVAEDGRRTTLAVQDIVRITPIGESFWSRVDGYWSVGLSYTKGSDVGQFSTGAGAVYRTRKLKTAVDVSSIVTTDSDGETTSRDSFSLDHTRYCDRLFARFDGLTEKNEALGLDLRTLASVAVGRSLVHTNQALFEVSAGLAVSREYSTDSAEGQGSFEGVLSSNYSLFRFADPETAIDLNLDVFPSFTESGRVRTEFDGRIRRELGHDFFFELSGYASHDSEPPAAGAEKTDYGLVTSLGWSF